MLYRNHDAIEPSPGYAIARIAKLKKGNLAGSAAHSSRQRYTPNADPKQTNIRFIGELDPNSQLEDVIMAKIGSYKQKRKIRTDAVYCVELLLTASPSYFRPHDPSLGGYYEDEKLDSWLDANRQWLNEKYGDRIVRAELHLDEMTPHIHAYLVPLDEAGQLRCNYFFNGRQKLRSFQDDYYAAMQHLGLERGIKGSQAQHQDIKDFYRIVTEGKDFEASDLKPAQLLAKAADRERAELKKTQMERTAKVLAAQNEILQQLLKQLEAENQQWQQQAQLWQDLPLEEVAWNLGLDPVDNWDSFKSDRPVCGAIDLVMHVQSYNYRQAVAWLCDRFGSTGMLQAVTHHARLLAQEIVKEEPVPLFVPPTRDEEQWEAVRTYLVKKQQLPSTWVDGLKMRGLIYSDSQQNAVFVMRSLDHEELLGAYLEATQDENNPVVGYASGTKRNGSWFYFRDCNPDAALLRAVLCKSPIDTLSRAALEYPVKSTTIYIAVDSTYSLPVKFLEEIPSVVCAYNKDDMGNKLASSIKHLLPQATRLKTKTREGNEQFVFPQSREEKHRHYELE